MAYMSLIIYIFLDKLWLCRFYSFCILILCSGCVGLATWLNKHLMRLLLNLIALMKSPTRTAPLLCSFFGIISPCGPRIYRRREVNAINFSLPSLLEASVNFLFIYFGFEVQRSSRIILVSKFLLWFNYENLVVLEIKYQFDCSKSKLVIQGLRVSRFQLCTVFSFFLSLITGFRFFFPAVYFKRLIAVSYTSCYIYYLFIFLLIYVVSIRIG